MSIFWVLLAAAAVAAAFDPAVHRAMKRDFADFAEFARMVRRTR